MGFCDHGVGTQLLTGGHTGHIHDLHRGVHDVLVGVQRQIETGDVTAAVAHTTDDHIALFLLDDHMVVCHLQDIHFRVVVEDLLGGVRAAFLIKLGVETHVGGDHDHVGLPVDGLDCFLDCGAGGLIGAFLDAGLAAVPDGHIGGDHADDGDLHAIPLGDGPACAGHKIAAGVLDIGCQHGEVGLTEDGLHGRDAPVELMVAKRHGIVAHLVHGGDHRMRLIRPLVGDVVGHDRA